MKFSLPGIRDVKQVISLPFLIALLAAAQLALALVWAYQWYSLPFIGVFVEPNLVISRIGEADWPARAAGAEWPDRLRAVNGRQVGNAKELNAALAELKGESAQVVLLFEQRGENEAAQGSYELVVHSRHVELGELLTQFIVPYLVGIALLGTGFWVYRLGGDQSAARAFLIFTAAGSVTTGAYLDVNTTHYFVLGWSLSLTVVAASIGVLAMVFPTPLPFVQRHPYLRYLPWLVVLPAAVIGVREILWPSNPWGYIQPWIWGYGLIALAILLFLGMLVYRIVTSMSPVIRQQSRIIIFGAALAFGPLLLFYLVPISFGTIPAFQSAFYFPPVLIFLLSVAYAIVRYRLLDADRVLGLAMNYLLTSVAAVVLFYLIVAVVSYVLGRAINPNNPAVVALYLLVLVLLLTPLRTLAQATIDRLFYRTNADYRQIISKLSRELVVSPNVRETQGILEREMVQALQPRHFTLYLYNDDRGIYLPLTNHPEADLSLPPESALIQLINREQKAIWLPPGQPLPASLVAETESLDTLDCQVYVPLHYEERLIGFFGLGERLSGIPYSSNDLDFLSAVAAQSTLALENARLFTNLQRTLNETLEMKNLMDDIFASIASGVITTDLEQKVTLFNQAAERILGASAEQVLGHRLVSVMPALASQLESIAEATICEGQITIDEEITPSVPERGELFLRLSCAPLRDARLETKGATIVIDDLTEQRFLESERERISQTFGRVVSHRVRDRLLSDPGSLRLDGTRQQIAVLFADIHGFTPLSEKSVPETLFAVLNSYLSLAANVILEEEGTLDKFMGDAVMAMWNAPDEQEDYALKAMRAALAINRVTAEHFQSLPVEHQLQFSIGITCGEAMVGNVGTSQLFNYTAIGDTVNLAQRLEALAAPEQILISEEAYRMVAEQVNAHQLPPVRVKGREHEEVIYELLGMKGV
ncbi:MAG: PAS domain-containing protein [Anaerolineales bacterium]|nr:PAS domain-containing protein [Anaerolineales bacterium]